MCKESNKTIANVSKVIQDKKLLYTFVKNAFKPFETSRTLFFDTVKECFNIELNLYNQIYCDDFL